FTELPLQSGEAGRVLCLATARHRGRRETWAQARSPHQGPRMATHRCEAAVALCHGNLPRKLPLPGIHRAAAAARCGAGGGGHGGVAAAVRRDGGLRLLPAARLAGALYERLSIGDAGCLGEARGDVVARGRVARWRLRASPEGPESR